MMKNRKGARSFKELDLQILEQLNQGRLESVNLTEWLAVDRQILIKSFLTEIGKESYLDSVLDEIDNLKKVSQNTLNEAVGRSLCHLSKDRQDDYLFGQASQHRSDTVRCWAVYMIASNTEMSIEDKLKGVYPFARDPHFGVREVAWMAIRQDIINDLDRSLDFLVAWALSDNENIRRFASEATRPRGVWCSHIEKLKKNPALAINILEPLKSDSSKYVRDSVGNWLNDASKTQTDFVLNLCARWESGSPTKETAYIIKKALRSISKTS